MQDYYRGRRLDKGFVELRLFRLQAKALAESRRPKPVLRFGCHLRGIRENLRNLLGAYHGTFLQIGG